MSVDKNRLKALAEAAPSGPWLVESDSMYFKEDGYTRHLLDADSGQNVEEDRYYAALEFMAAANPSVVSALLADVERLETDTASLEFVRWSHKVNMAAIEAAGHETIDALAQERDQLKAENESLRNQLGREERIFSMAADELIKDAERYRWLRKLERSCFELDSVFDEFGIPLDDKIDLAMAREHNQ